MAATQKAMSASLSVASVSVRYGEMRSKQKRPFASASRLSAARLSTGLTVQMSRLISRTSLSPDWAFL